MGTSAPPATGYTDDQRVENWDGPLAFTDSVNPLTPGIPTTVINVSRYAYLGGFDSVIGGDAYVQIGWSFNQDGSNICGGRTLQLTSNIPGGAQYRLPNLGPYVKLFWGKLGGGAPTHNSLIFPTNRFHPLEFIPQNPVLITQDAVAIAANQALHFYPADYYAGPVTIGTFISQQGQIVLEYLDAAGVWRTGSYAPTLPPSTWEQRNMLAPPGAWRITMINDTGVPGTLYCHVMHSQTGSS